MHHISLLHDEYRYKVRRRNIPCALIHCSRFIVLIRKISKHLFSRSDSSVGILGIIVVCSLLQHVGNRYRGMSEIGAQKV